MSAEADALNAAADQVLALLGETRRSNMQLIHGSDGGGVDALAIHPVPAVLAWSDDLLILTDVLHVSTSATPTLQVSDLAPIPIVWADGSAVQAGDVKGLALFKISGAAGLGWKAQILALSVRTTAAPAAPAPVTTPDREGTGIGAMFKAPYGNTPFSVAIGTVVSADALIDGSWTSGGGAMNGTYGGADDVRRSVLAGRWTLRRFIPTAVTTVFGVGWYGFGEFERTQ